MTDEAAAALRAQAAHAREIAGKVYDRQVEADLRLVADSFDAEADEIMRIRMQNDVPPSEARREL